MKLRIRQPDLKSSVEIKQLPSKQVFLFTLTKTSKSFLVPITVLPLPFIPDEESAFVSFVNFVIQDNNSEYKKQFSQQYIQSQALQNAIIYEYVVNIKDIEQEYIEQNPPETEIQ